MQLRNNYYKEVFNGDIGLVSGLVAATGQLQVDFDGRVVTYDAAAKDEVTLAYAVTVHKAQGSEFPGVLLVLTTHHYMLLQRNLLVHRPDPGPPPGGAPGKQTGPGHGHPQ